MLQGIDNDYDGRLNAADPTPNGDPRMQLRELLSKLVMLLGEPKLAAMPDAGAQKMMTAPADATRMSEPARIVEPGDTQHTEDATAQQAAEDDYRGGKSFEEYHGARGRPVGTAKESRRGKLREMLMRLSEGSATGTEPLPR